MNNVGDWGDAPDDDGGDDGPNGPGNGNGEPEYLITIEYDYFITRLDLDEILKSIDQIIEAEVLSYYYPERLFTRRTPFEFSQNLSEPVFSYLGITAVTSGSIILSTVVGSAVVHYVTKRFRRGINESLFADELQRSGRLAGDLLGPILRRVNNWAEGYVSKQKELGGNVTKITAKRKGRSKKDKDS